MKKEKIKTDDASFGYYLSKLDHNSLFSHASENMLPDAIIDVIMTYEHMQIDLVKIMFKDDITLPEKLRTTMLREELELKEEKYILLFMDLLFSKKEIIDMLLEYSDEDARLSIIENQNEWDKPCDQSINYN